jgi:hypothetical protein
MLSSHAGAGDGATGGRCRASVTALQRREFAADYDERTAERLVLRDRDDADRRAPHFPLCDDDENHQSWPNTSTNSCCRPTEAWCWRWTATRRSRPKPWVGAAGAPSGQAHRYETPLDRKFDLTFGMLLKLQDLKHTI